jgi:hypothetical protein
MHVRRLDRRAATLMKVWRTLVQLVGGLGIGLSIWGFFLLVDAFRRVRTHPPIISGIPFFRQACLTMNSIDAVLLTSMVLVAIGMLRASRTAVKFYTWLYVIVVLYAFLPGAIWGSGPLGRSISAASGSADLGISPLLFYPIPFAYAVVSVAAVNLASSRLNGATSLSSVP